MGDFARLDRGFVNWRGQRVFVPSLGAPRVVPTTEDEVRILKLEFRMDIVLAVYLVAFFIAFFIAVGLLSAHVPIGMFALGAIALPFGILAILVIFGIVQRRLIGRWPLQSTSRFSRFRFMLSYFKSRGVGERLFELFWGLFGLLLLIPLLAKWVEDFLASPGEISATAKLVFHGMVISILGMATFYFARLGLLAALALAPRVGWLANLAK